MEVRHGVRDKRFNLTKCCILEESNMLTKINLFIHPGCEYRMRVKVGYSFVLKRRVKYLVIRF